MMTVNNFNNTDLIFDMKLDLTSEIFKFVFCWVGLK